MSWLALITALVKLAVNLSTWASNRGLINQAEQAQLAALLVKESENVDRARRARLAQRQHDAGGVPDEPDRFRRD